MAGTMSQLNNHLGNFMWKNFVRETDSQTQNISHIHKDRVNFEGDMAKIAYEQIINDDTASERIRNPENPHQNDVVASVPNMKNLEREKKIICNSHSKSGMVEMDANKILKAVEQGDVQYLKDVLTNKNVNIVDNFGWTPLMSAAFCGNEFIVKFLLELGANKSCRDKSGSTALKLAEKRNNPKIISLLKFGDIFDKKEKIPENHVKIRKFYCSMCKATFNETTAKDHGSSTLHIFNTNPKLPDPIYGITPRNRGYQIMLNNGWEESKGLGPSGKGLKYPVKTVLKQDRKGLGHRPKPRARITHFQSGDTDSVLYARKSTMKTDIKNITCKQNYKILRSQDRRKEIAIRRALS